MKIAVLSGKGGTGKTLVSVNLAALAEMPHISTRCGRAQRASVFKPADVVTERSPSKSRRWIRDYVMVAGNAWSSATNALAYVDQRLMIFEEVCHPAGAAYYCAL